MERRQFTKVSVWLTSKKAVSKVQCPLLKYLIRKQQIQQMSSLSQDNGLIIFCKLKHLFFPEIEEDEQIISIVREDPIKTIDKVLLTITQYYNQKLAQVIQPLEQEKNHLLKTLKQTNQKLQHYMDDNQYFKTTIDRLQEEKKDIECLLNQSQDQIERSYQEFETVIGQKQKIKSEVLEMFESYQCILAENSQLKDINSENQSQLISCKKKYQELLDAHLKLCESNKQLENHKLVLLQQNTRLKDQNQALIIKVHQKEEFIASFINQYNKIHYFQKHQDSYNDPDKVAVDNNKDTDFNQLKGFNFNQFDKNSVESGKSSKKSSAKIKSKANSNQKDCEMDEKFLYVNATSEKLKIPLPHKTTGSQNKSRGQIQERMKLLEPEKRNFVQQQILQNKKKTKPLAKAESSKNFRNRETIATPSEAQDSKMSIQQVLRKKLVEKNAKIGRLQFELSSLRSQYIEQRQNITEMQGNYEIQIFELKQELKYLKTQMNALYQSYALANSDCEIYQQKVMELQNQLERIEQEHRFYCQQLKRRCKLYIIKKLDQAEVHYETIRSIQQSTKKKEQPQRHYKKVRNFQKFYTEQAQVDEGQEERKQTLSLKLHEDNQQSQQVKQQEERFSDVYSYQHLSNHHVGGLGLDLEFSLTNKNNDGEQLQEIFIRQNFQIQSDLGGFTQRMKANQVQNNKCKGNFTDRVSAKLLKSMIEIKVKSKIVLQSNVFSLDIHPTLKNINFYPLYELLVSPNPKKLCISNQTNEKVTPLRKRLSIASQACKYTYYTYKKLNFDSQLLLIKIVPFKESGNLKVCKLNPTCLKGKQRRQMQLVKNNITEMVQNWPKSNKVSNFISIYSNFLQIQESRNNSKNSYKSTSTQTDQFSRLSKEKSNLSLFQASSIQFCSVLSPAQHNKAISDHNQISQGAFLSQSIITLQIAHKQQEVKLSPQKDDVQEQQEKQLIISRLDQFSGNELQEKQNDQQKQEKQAYQKVNCLKSQQEIREAQKIQEAKPQKQDQIDQKSRIKQQTKASTVETAQWYQINKHQKNIDNKGYEVQRRYQLPQRDASLYQEQSKHSLNKAIILSNNHSEKADSQKSSSNFNPETKHNRAVTQLQDCRITPWFIDEKKHLIVNNQMISIQGLPDEIIKNLQPENVARLVKFLKQNGNVTLKFLQLFNEENFRKPTDLTMKLYILNCKTQEAQKTFLIAKKFVYCLQDKTRITVDKRWFLNKYNFCLGQCQIVISNDAKLKLNRKHKFDKLRGNIDDGIWQITSYMSFEYSAKPAYQ